MIKVRQVIKVRLAMKVGLVIKVRLVIKVLKAIQECHLIVSSSMHGLIVSDAFGVPNRRIAISRGMISDYKFGDYYSAFGIAEPACLTPEDFLAGASAVRALAAFAASSRFARALLGA